MLDGWINKIMDAHTVHNNKTTSVITPVAFSAITIAYANMKTHNAIARIGIPKITIIITIAAKHEIVNATQS